MSVDTLIIRVDNLISQLSDEVDELDRLHDMSGSVSVEDTRELVVRTLNCLKSIDVQLTGQQGDRDVIKYERFVRDYNALVYRLERFGVDGYAFSPSFKPEPVIKRAKSVRFKDNLIEPATVSKTVATYRDEPSEFSYTPPAPPVERTEITNQQVFIDNQQEIYAQDEMLSQLATSISRQNQMGSQIGDELDDHMVILDDLEMMVDRSDRKLHRARARLGRFSEKLRKNGEWTTIVVLIIILLFLLIVLK